MGRKLPRNKTNYNFSTAAKFSIKNTVSRALNTC